MWFAESVVTRSLGAIPLSVNGVAVRLTFVTSVDWVQCVYIYYLDSEIIKYSIQRYPDVRERSEG